MEFRIDRRGRSRLTGPAELGLTRRKVRDMSIALVVAGTALFMPPLIGVSLVDGKVAGIPIPIVYVSVVWAALIAAAAVLARPLQNSESAASSGNANDAAG